VQVCPTGIDIRNGLQYDCIACGACIDACNGVMDKMHYPRGLIRYATENGMEGRWSRERMLRRVLRPRVLVYGGILLLITAAVLASIALRQPFKVDVVRDRASLARIVDDGWVENVYRLQLMNATERGATYRVQAEGLEGVRVAGNAQVSVDSAQARWLPVAVRVPHATAQQSKPGAHPIRFRVQRIGPDDEGSTAEVVEKSTFVVPR
jgi:cytochrome c oxidase accessory protein FixG